MPKTTLALLCYLALAVLCADRCRIASAGKAMLDIILRNSAATRMVTPLQTFGMPRG